MSWKLHCKGGNCNVVQYNVLFVYVLFKFVLIRFILCFLQSFKYIDYNIVISNSFADNSLCWFLLIVELWLLILVMIWLISDLKWLLLCKVLLFCVLLLSDSCQKNSPNEYADMGGAYFGRRQTKIIELAKELGLKFYNLPVAGKTVFKFKVQKGCIIWVTLLWKRCCYINKEIRSITMHYLHFSLGILQSLIGRGETKQ